MSYKFDPKDDVDTQYQKWLDSDVEYQDIEDRKSVV